MAIHHRPFAPTCPSLRALRHCVLLGLVLACVSACSTDDSSSTGVPSGSSPTAGGGTGGTLHESGGSNSGGAVSAGVGGAPEQGGSNAAGTDNAAGSAGNTAGSAGNTAGSAGNGGSAGNVGSAGNAGNAGGGGNGGGGNAGSAGTGGGTSTYDPCPTDGSPCKIMPFGDSITDGYGVPGGYRIELFTLAHQAGKKLTFVGSGQNGPTMVDNVAFPQHHEGHSGFTIDPTQSRSGISPLVATVMPAYTPHIVTLMIGTNDAIDDNDMANAPTRLGKLIDSIFTQLPSALIVLAQIIPSRDDALNGRIQTYNAAIPGVVQTRANAGKHLLLVDMYPVIGSNPNYKTALLNDTWHPNDAGYALMAEAWYGVLGSLLH